MSKPRRITAAVLFGAAGVFVVAWVVLVITDWVNYSKDVNSAPFWVFILGRAVFLLIPALIFTVGGMIVSKRFKTFL